jgi:hypothetical protein
MTELEQRLAQKLEGERRVVLRRGKSSAAHWDGKYGRGPGLAEPCVEFAACEMCRARPGQLCRGPCGPKFSTHYVRRRAFVALRRRIRAALDEKARS